MLCFSFASDAAFPCSSFQLLNALVGVPFLLCHLLPFCAGDSDFLVLMLLSLTITPLLTISVALTGSLLVDVIVIIII
jgi:hypothetical protein